MADFDRLWNHDDDASTESAFRALLPEAATRGRDWHAQLLTQVARTLTKRQRWDEAHAVLDEAEALLGDDTPTARLPYLLERGRGLQWSGRKDEARPLYVEAWERGKLRPEWAAYAVDAAHMLAILEDPSDAALQWSETAMTFIESGGLPGVQGWLGPLYHDTGCTYFGRKDYPRALSLFEKSLAFRERFPERPEPIRVARWMVARVYRSLGRIDEAMAMQRDLERENEALGDPGGFVCEELAELLLLRGEAREARGYFARAYASLKDDAWFPKEHPDRLARMQELGAPRADEGS